MNIRIDEIPFSRRGSYFAVSYLEEFQAICLRDVHGGDESPSELFELLLPDIESSDLRSESFKELYDVTTTETILTIQRKDNSQGTIRIILPTEAQLRIEVTGLKLGLKAHKVRYDTLNQLAEGQYEYISYKKESKYLIELTAAQVTAPWYRVGNTEIEIELDGTTEKQEMTLLNYQVVPPKSTSQALSFNEAHQQVVTEYQDWLASSLSVPQKWSASQALANYIIWSSIVRPEGLLSHEAVYMSKNWMQNIWSWDNCFNAMGIGQAHPELAFAQFQVFIDHQSEAGVYPDFINNQFVSYNCCKPPIHAWAYNQLIAKNDYFKDETRLGIIYQSLVKSTNFWLDHRLDEAHQLPYYTHGNDSGWDNASVFHHGLPVIAPDLTAYLIQQMDILAAWASQLGLTEEAQQWTEQATSFTETLLKELYNGQQFIAKSARTGQEIPEQASLLLYLPLVIAYRLPAAVVSQLVKQITTRFEGEFGLSTESASSPHYQVDGYWLGPIWAPETYIFFDAFKRSGEIAIAQRLAEKYCTVASLGGMAENYNPETGAGNDDLSFTWTSSVFLLLGNYLKSSRSL